MVTVTLLPSRDQIPTASGTRLNELLAPWGGESPCGGQGTCRGCRVKVISGNMPVTDKQREVLLPRELDEGWRLACQCRVTDDISVIVPSSQPVVLADDTIERSVPEEGYGIAADVGTTTLAVQLVDLKSGKVVGLRTGLNPQSSLGADVMSRIEAAVRGSARDLTLNIQNSIASMVADLMREHTVGPVELKRILLVGNTVMHHLFCGLPVQPLSQVPFETPNSGLVELPTSSLFPFLNDATQVMFLPCMGGFVGSDVLAGISAVHLLSADGINLLVDLGTNGEVVLGHDGEGMCASTAAGPAFEGARISCGMRASDGAIWRVVEENGSLVCDVIGNVEPRGVCGSGLVDAVAAALRLGLIEPSGRIKDGKLLWLAGNIALTQADIRQLQLAKAAVSAGIAVLLDRWCKGTRHVESLFLAGAFGNYINIRSALQIGLFPCTADRIMPAGNSALRGARRLLGAGEHRFSHIANIVSHVKHVPLASDPAFFDHYVEQIPFPEIPFSTRYERGSE